MQCNFSSFLMHVVSVENYLLTGNPVHLSCTTLWLCCFNPALLCSLRCLVFRGVIWFSSSRYCGRPAGAQHPPGHTKTQLPVEARHEHFTRCPGAVSWACQGKHYRNKVSQSAVITYRPGPGEVIVHVPITQVSTSLSLVFFPL